MRTRTIDLRPRCERCQKLPRGKMNLAAYEKYKPYCSYHCQEWAALEGAMAYIKSVRPDKGAEK